MDQVAVNINEGRLRGGLVHNVGLPNLFVHCLRWHVVSNHPSFPRAFLSRRPTISMQACMRTTARKSRVFIGAADHQEMEKERRREPRTRDARPVYVQAA